MVFTVSDFVEIHLGRALTLSALADMLTEIGVQRFQGFVRVNESGNGRFALSFARSEGGEATLFMLVRENPSQLYAEPTASFAGAWALEVYAYEIAVRMNALIAGSSNRMLHRPTPAVFPTFADWLLGNPSRAAMAEEVFAAISPSVPLPLRGVVSFQQRHQF